MDDNAGQNPHLLLSMLVKHLEHQRVSKKPEMQLNIVKVTTVIARHLKIQPSVAIIGAVDDLMRHLRKNIQSSAENNLENGVADCDMKFLTAVDDCLVQTINKVSFYPSWTLSLWCRESY